MSNISITKAATAFLALAAFAPVHADEGMWTLYDLPQAVYARMVEEGFQMPYSDLYHGTGALKNAVVNFSGYCSGVVVSPDGLVFTNHHCGFEAIRSHSTVEHDYMLNGFYAKSYEEELPNEDMFVSFMVSQQDVTSKVAADGYDTMAAGRKNEYIDSLEQAMTDSVKRIDKTLHVQIDAFYEGNKYYATVYQDFTDLRLVFAIPKSMGKFGGETDNWMWPRQTCDFSVFRIYADPKTNGPAAYSKDNVPYHPSHWAPVSMDGYKEGDFAMTVGYPGSTERYLSSYGVREMRDAENAVRAQARGVRQEVMQRHMRASEAVRIKYDSKYANSANYWKNSIGMNKCIDSIGIIQQKQAYEQRVQNFQDFTGYLRDKLSFPTLERLYAQRYTTVHDFYEFYENLRNNEFCRRAMAVHTLPLHGSPKKPARQYAVFEVDTATWDAATEKEIMAVMLKNYKEHVLDTASLPAFYKTIESEYHNDYAAYVDYLWSASRLMKNGERIYVNGKKAMQDPGVRLGIDLNDMWAAMRTAMKPVSDSIAEQERWLCAAKLRMEQELPHYSDANFTMRLSYGQVGGFSLGGKPSGYYTTAESLVEKMGQGDRGVIDYQVEPVMKELLSAKSFAPYSDKATGKMQLCFLTNNDITGGNSGSPMFDGKGRLIGLAFDGNWDSLSSDINFDRRLARCIGVDIRYVLFMMDRWGHADRLLHELGIGR